MRINHFIRVLMLLFFLSITAHTPTEAYGAEPVKIGVLAFRPKPQTLAQWQPLAVALKQALPEYDFAVEAFNYSELNQAVATRQLDFVLTNPGHYIQLAQQNGLSSPLATVIALNKNNRPSSVYGGVIFCRAGQADINTLRDIKGKTVAIVTTEAFSAYQAQAYELKQFGIRLPQDITLMPTGMPHDKVVEAVLAGRAEVGFVRSAVLEGMANDGKLDLKQLKILNPQTYPGFSQLISTRLYPEWPFVAMPQIDEDLARHVAAALFMLGDNRAATSAMGIHGFAVPADYSAVEEVLRGLHLPPFDIAPAVTWHDLWESYRWELMGGVLAFVVIVILGMGLLFANRKLAERQQMLQEKEEKYRTLVETTPDWIWEVDRNGRYTYVSPKLEALLGYKPEEVLGKTPFDFMPPEEQQRISPIFSNLLATHAPLVTLENTNLHKDGRLVILETSGTAFFDRQGEFAGYRGIDRDITEQKRLEAEIVKARNLESLGILAGGIAHDFNNLFQVLIGNIQLAMMKTEESSEAFKFLKNAEQTSGLATKLTSQLIAFSPGGDSVPIDIQPASHIREEAVLTLAGSGLVAEFDLAENLWPINADPFQFRNVIKQLVLNAREAMSSKSGGRLTIVAANEPLPEPHKKHPPLLAPGNYVRISIADQGCGISKENLPHIFDPYFSTKKRGAQKGMGFGLALCDAIARKLGGAITVESELGKGSTFHLYLPAVVG